MIDINQRQPLQTQVSDVKTYRVLQGKLPIPNFMMK